MIVARVNIIWPEWCGPRADPPQDGDHRELVERAADAGRRAIVDRLAAGGQAPPAPQCDQLSFISTSAPSAQASTCRDGSTLAWPTRIDQDRPGGGGRRPAGCVAAARGRGRGGDQQRGRDQGRPGDSGPGTAEGSELHRDPPWNGPGAAGAGTLRAEDAGKGRAVPSCHHGRPAAQGQEKAPGTDGVPGAFAAPGVAASGVGVVGADHVAGVHVGLDAAQSLVGRARSRATRRARGVSAKLRYICGAAHGARACLTTSTCARTARSSSGSGDPTANRRYSASIGRARRGRAGPGRARRRGAAARPRSAGTRRPARRRGRRRRPPRRAAGEQEPVARPRDRLVGVHVQVAELGHRGRGDRVGDGPERAQRREQPIGLAPGRPGGRPRRSRTTCRGSARGPGGPAEVAQPAHRGQLVGRVAVSSPQACSTSAGARSATTARRRRPR